MFSLAFRTFEFLVYHLLIVVVDRVSRLPCGSNPPEVRRLNRENLALKAQNGALLLELDAARGKWGATGGVKEHVVRTAQENARRTLKSGSHGFEREPASTATFAVLLPVLNLPCEIQASRFASAVIP